MAKIFLFFIILFLFFVGIITSDDDFNSVDLNNKKPYISGNILSNVEEKNGKKEFVVHGYSVSITSKENLFYGDYVELSCSSIYVAKKYMQVNKVFYVCNKPKMLKYIFSKEHDFYYYLLKFKQNLMSKISSLYSKPYDAFVSGILFGYKGLDKDISTLFSNSGISHIIAISGYNISIIVTILSSLFIRVGVNRFKSFYFIVFIIFLFTIFTGASSSVVRASIMGCISLFALQFGRKSNAINLLFIVGFIMVLFNPLILIYDIGFQLSFLATFGILLLNPILEKIFINIEEFLGVKSSLFTTVSAFIMTSPVIFINFGKFGFLPILINILVLPTVPLIMLFGFISIVLSFVPFLYFIFKFFSFLATFLMEYIILVCRIFY